MIFSPDLTACLTQSLQHAASQGNWDPPRWTGRLSPESALLVNSCFPSPKPPESATAVPFSSLKGLWNGVAAWCLVVSETPAWSLRLTSLMCTCAHIHVTLRCTHTCALGGFPPVSESCIGPWALTCCLYSFTWNALFGSSQDSRRQASWVCSSQPCLRAPVAPGRSSRIRAFLSSSCCFEASPLPGSLPLLITGMMCEPWASPLLRLVQTGNSYSFL